jgi:hypothetical protein
MVDSCGKRVENLDLPVENPQCQVNYSPCLKNGVGGGAPQVRARYGFVSNKEMSRNSHDLLISLDKCGASCYLSERSERFVARSANAVSVHFATLNSTTPPFLFFPSRIPLGRGV